MGINGQIPILIADDFASIRQVIKSTLLKLGFSNFSEASDGVKAWECILGALERDTPFKVVFLDIGMPNMTGLDVLKNIREHAELKDTKVIIVSAENERKSIIDAHKMGANAYIVKPFNAQTILEKLKDILEK